MTRENSGDYAQRFETLLRMFLKDDGTPWKGRDFERASEGKLSSSYITALRQGNIKRPGFEALSLIARIMRFDVELWTLEAEEFDRYTPGGSTSSSELDPRLLKALDDERRRQILRKSLTLSDDECDTIIELIDNRHLLWSFQDLLSLNTRHKT